MKNVIRHLSVLLLTLPALLLPVFAATHEIADADDFYSYAVQIASGDTELAADDFVLTNPIGFYGHSFMPFGTVSTPFTGEFDGNGYSLNDITLKSSQKAIGVFGAAENAYIHDLGVVNITVTGNANAAYAGLLVGQYTKSAADTDECIERCHVSGKLTVQSQKYKTVYAGGVVGYLTAADYHTSVGVTDAFADVDIRVSGCSDARVGGIAGYAGFSHSESSVTLHRLIVRGSLDVDASVSAVAGGLVGFLHNDKGWIWTNTSPDASLSADAAGEDIRSCFCLCTINAVSAIVTRSPSVAKSNEECVMDKVYYGSQITGEFGENDILADTALLADTAFLTDVLGLRLGTVWTLPQGADVPMLCRRTAVLSEDEPIWEEGAVTFRAAANAAPSAMFLAAAYDEDGRLIGTKTGTVPQDLTQTFDIPCASIPAVIRLFVLDGCTPLCPNALAVPAECE